LFERIDLGVAVQLAADTHRIGQRFFPLGDQPVAQPLGLDGLWCLAQRTATDLVDQFAWNSPAMDRASSANPRIISMYTSTNLYYTDLTTFAVTSVALQATGVSPRGATILYNRNVQTVRTAPVATLVTATETPGSTAPDSSKTRP